jgi:hypothetical protein
MRSPSKSSRPDPRRCPQAGRIGVEPFSAQAAGRALRAAGLVRLLAGLALASGGLMAVMLMLWSPGAQAAKGFGGVFPPEQLAQPPVMPLPFAVTGFIQAATLDTRGDICTASDPRLRGGTVTVNGQKIIVPCNTVLQMPALAVTWHELFSMAPADIKTGTGPQTALALQDTVADLSAASPRAAYNGALPSFEITVQGNIVDGRYIAGLVFVSQQSLNVGQGVINFINYAKGELHVGGKPGVAGPGDVRVRLNDPEVPGTGTGRFGRSHGGPSSSAEVKEAGYDARFTVDQDNPTVHALTGYPMCIPRANPFTVGDDLDCPMSNRPVAPRCASLPSPFTPFTMPAAGARCRSFMMAPPPVTGSAPCSGPACPTDPTRQAPLVVGDFIDYQGTLKVDPVSGPYISAHTLVANLGIYTTPGTQPVYATIEGLLTGTGGAPVANLPQEATSRLRVEGFVTDPTWFVDIYAMDIDAYTGAATDRLLGTVDPGNPPVVGRFRFVPQAGGFMPPTRNYRVVSRGACADNGRPCTLAADAPRVANGLLAGQYNAPVFEYIFAENRVMGDAQPPANLQDLPFLYCGSGPLTTPTAGRNPPVVGQLMPAPWKAPMPTPNFASTLCPSAPVVGDLAPTTPVGGTAGAPTLSTQAIVDVNAGAAVTLSATASDINQPPMPVNFLWQQISGPQVVIQPEGNLGQRLAFTAPTAPTPLPAVLQFMVTATNGLASTSTTVKVNVAKAPADAVTISKVLWTNAKQNRGQFQVVASSSLPATTPGLQLFVQASADWYMVDTLSNTMVPVTLELAQVPLAMSLVQNPVGVTGAGAVCPSAAPCWQFVMNSVLSAPDNGGVFIVPQTVTVTSTRGGAATATGSTIVVK